MKQTKTIIALSLSVILGAGTGIQAQSPEEGTANMLNEMNQAPDNGPKAKPSAPKPSSKSAQPSTSRSDNGKGVQGQGPKQAPSISHKQKDPSINGVTENPADEPTPGTQPDSQTPEVSQIPQTPSYTTRNTSREHIQSVVEDYIVNQIGDTGWDEEDGSLNFESGGTFYWLVFDEVKSKDVPKGTYQYTLHKQTIRPKEVDLYPEDLIYAADYINRNAPYKANYNRDSKGDKIELSYPVYASTPEELCNVLNLMIQAMGNSDNLYKKGLAEGIEKNNAIRENLISGRDFKSVIPREPNERFVPTIDITDIQPKFILKENNGNEVEKIQPGATEYANTLFNFIKPTVFYKFRKDGTDGCVISMKVIDPEGKVLVDDEDGVYTSTTYISNGKNEKNKNSFDFEKIGTTIRPQPNGIPTPFWKEGAYTIELYENDHKLPKSYTFTVVSGK